MKIKIPYVVVTAVKGREVDDVGRYRGTFIDVPAESAGDSND